MSTSIIDPHGDGALPGGAAGGAGSAAALASPWNLCFLSGPMYGRTMSLARGANWVGTAADCEVILPDREIGAKQVCLQVGALAVTVQNHGGDAGAPVLFNDEPLGTGRRSLTPNDVVTVGSIRLGIARHAQASVAVPDETDAPDAAREAAWLGWLTGGLRRLGSRRLVIALVALWVGVLLGALGYGFVAWSGRLPWQHESVLARTHRLQQLLHAYPELAVAPRDDGVIVSGYVSDPAARERVAQIVAGVDNAALGNIYVVSDLVATAQTYFSDTALTVTYLGRGRIELTGTAARADRAAHPQLHEGRAPGARGGRSRARCRCGRAAHGDDARRHGRHSGDHDRVRRRRRPALHRDGRRQLLFRRRAAEGGRDRRVDRPGRGRVRTQRPAHHDAARRPVGACARAGVGAARGAARERCGGGRRAAGAGADAVAARAGGRCIDEGGGALASRRIRRSANRAARITRHVAGRRRVTSSAGHGAAAGNASERHVKERNMTAPTGSATDTKQVQQQADDLTKTQLELTKINFQVQQSTATFETSNAVTAQEGTANAQVAQHLSSAGRA